MPLIEDKCDTPMRQWYFQLKGAESVLKNRVFIPHEVKVMVQGLIGCIDEMQKEIEALKNPAAPGKGE